jgi:hypothetical protein
MIGGMLATVLFADFDGVDRFPYYKDISVRAEKGVLASSDLDDHVLSYSNYDYTNTHLVDNLGSPISFTIRPKQNRNVRFYDVPVLVQRRSSRALEGGGVEVIYRKQQTSVDPTKLILELEAPGYEVQVRVWGSNDAVNWQELSEDILIFNYPDPIYAANNEITIDARKINYFKIAISTLDVTEESPYMKLSKDSVVSGNGLEFDIKIKDARFYQTKSGISSDVVVTQEYTFMQKRVRKHQNNSQYILGSSRQPIHTFIIESRTPIFSRSVVIQGRTGNDEWVSIYDGKISQVEYNGKRYSHTRIPLGRTYRFDDYVVMIGDSTNSLDVSSIYAEGHTLELVYLNSEHSPLRFYYGGVVTQSHVTSDNPVGKGALSKVVQDMQPEKLNPSFTGAHDLSVQYIIKQRGFLFFAGGSFLILIMLFLSNRSKK